MVPVLKAALAWFLRWLLLVSLICFAGALAGLVLFPVGGHLLGMELSTAEMARNGAFDGGFLALIWAPGLGLVICIMWARDRWVKKRDKNP